MRYDITTIKIKLKIADSGQRNKVGTSTDAYGIAKPIFADMDADQEHMIILALDNSGRITGYKHIHSGGTNDAIVDAKIVFRSALLLGATKIIFAHNHPSGNACPSPEDISLTLRMVECGKLLQIEVLDHLVLGNEHYSSMADSRIL